MHPSGRTHIHACACTYMLYANDVISQHNKLQIFIANEEKSSQELLPADHARGKTFPEEIGLYNACRIETKA